ncbi:hypothetical protein HPP92_018818 [Vanilla planifolia]|uniref:Photosystem I reaction center subunit N, chloroplastic n=1 Tax=Vanilla planifolia TaxID=51239 RepID=A0A835Q7U8_VANPL|nr:hypothetical protein HPP92_018818 [Vanilla planifolia]
MAATNPGVLSCIYAISGSSEATRKPLASTFATKLPTIKAQQARPIESNQIGEGRRAALFGLGAVVFSAATAVATSSANASIFDEYLEKSKANKELNDKKRLATSGANLARAYTVEFGTCKIPENFTGCQDLAKQKKVKFLTEDLELECEGKDKYKCGSNVFWKW